MAGTIEILARESIAVEQIIADLAVTAYNMQAEFHLNQECKVLENSSKLTAFIQKKYKEESETLLFHIITDLVEQSQEYLQMIKLNEYQSYSNFNKDIDMSLIAYTENYENDIALDFTKTYINLNPNQFVTGEGFKSVISKEVIQEIEDAEYRDLYLETYESVIKI